MSWVQKGHEGIVFVGFAVVAFIIVLFLSGIFTNLIPSTSPFFPLVNTIVNGVSSTLTTIFQPLILIPLAVVIVILGAYALKSLAGATVGERGMHR